MNYFAKYLPTEGDVIMTHEEFVAQKQLFHDGRLYDHHPMLNNREPWKYTFLIPCGESTGTHVLIKECQPAVLTLCSHDVQKDDRVYFADPDDGISSGYYVVSSVGETIFIKSETAFIEALPEELVMIIGRISPDAIWVKEGDELEATEVNLGETFPGGSISREAQQILTGKTPDIKILGPCGHFH